MFLIIDATIDRAFDVFIVLIRRRCTYFDILEDDARDEVRQVKIKFTYDNLLLEIYNENTARFFRRVFSMIKFVLI